MPTTPESGTQPPTYQGDAPNRQASALEAERRRASRHALNFGGIALESVAPPQTDQVAGVLGAQVLELGSYRFSD